MLPAQRFQFIQRLRAAQAQGDLAALVEALVKATERLLEGRILQGQGVPVTGMKSAQWMAWCCGLQQGELLLGLRVTRPGNEFGMDYFTFAALALDAQVWLGQHLAQALQPPGQGAGRDLEEKVGGCLLYTSDAADE